MVKELYFSSESQLTHWETLQTVTITTRVEYNEMCCWYADERWQRVCAALVALQRASARVRVYCVHRHLPRALLAALQRLRDALSLHGKPAEVIRNADHVRIEQYFIYTGSCTLRIVRESQTENGLVYYNK